MATGDQAATVLSSDAAGDMLSTAVATAHQTLESWRLDAVHARPGAETSATYDVTVSGERQYLVASTVSLTEDERAAVKAVRLESDLGVVHVWRHPSDPRLPGLADACVPVALADRLARVGIGEATVEQLEMLVLRPMRRAVLRANVSSHGLSGRIYIKVLRPDAARQVLARHAACGLAPKAYDAGDGIVVIEGAAGRPLTEYLYRPDAPRYLDPAVLVAALDSVGPGAMEMDRRRSAADLIDTYTEAAVKTGADEARLEAVRTAIHALTDGAGDLGPLVPTHGDFHAANVFVDGGDDARVTALIDLDTLGPGYRVDDLACMLAHLHTLPTFDEHGYRDVPGLIRDATADFSRRVPPAQLRARAAAVLVSLMGGAEHEGRRDRWLAIAEHLVAEARQMRVLS
ncbi:aminoglycoside phosphotransferase family protein [Demequina sp. NBRC 110057]|uniref:aminoglycoside phosphotransferase family protein n=1 Tax=Demequina sp. NBRC 110057 TaxID=1570346 RepID=UPI000A04D4AF|nr:phosphotransferase [Demequina sp. NBRC 110057]